MDKTLPVCTVGYLVRGERGHEEIFLGEKAPTPKALKRGIAGKLIGYGGDYEPTDTSLEQSFQRELSEESGFKAEISDIETCAKVLIKDEKGPRLTLCYILVRKWTGEAKLNDEIMNPKWYSAHPLPDNVLNADKLILPRILSGEKLEGYVEYDRNLNVVSYNLSKTN